MLRLVCAVIALLTPALAIPALACGPDSDCTVGDRSYRLYVPEGVTPSGALFYAHGYKGSAAGPMRNENLREVADARGWAFVALASKGDDWELAHTPQNPNRDVAEEYAYVSAVIEDVRKRFPLRRDQMVLTGFSAGGMFTWTVACGMSDAFGGYVPMSGTFWAPVPQRCPTPPANVVHIHGDDDGVVPLTGRSIARAKQGSVFDTLAMYRQHARVSGSRRVFPGDMVCDKSTEGSRLVEFCLFEGGHSFSTARLQYAIDQVLGTSE